ncbi:MAG: F0F1 ATP synthase subunit epsilon [Alphaproteobacteria bacterium]
MADTIAFELVSPERLLMTADVHAVMVPGAEGDFTVLAGHAPVISTLKPAVVDVYETDGAEPIRMFVRGGFVDCALDRLTILAEEAIMLAELDKEALAQRIKNAAEDVEDAKTDDARQQAQEVHDQLNELLTALD